MLTIKEKSEIYRIGLLCGYFTKEQILNWVDKIILTVPEIDYALIEASLFEKGI